MATYASAQDTDFTHDVLGRYICNGLDEARPRANRAARPDARDFDAIVIGGGSFGPVFAQHLFAAGRTPSHPIPLLAAGPPLPPAPPPARGSSPSRRAASCSGATSRTCR